MIYTRKTILMTLAGVSALAFSGCATTVKSQSDPAQNFASYKTFTWAQTPPMVSDGEYAIPPMAQKSLTQAIKDTLVSRGYTFTEDAESADFAVMYTVGARDKIEMDSMPAPYFGTYSQWGWGHNNFPVYIVRGGSLLDREKERTYTKGNLAIDIFDVKSKSPVWHAGGSKRLSQKQFNSPGIGSMGAVEAILVDFPPGRAATVKE